MPVTQYEIAPMTGAALWGFLEKAPTMRLATVSKDEAIEVSPARERSNGEDPLMVQLDQSLRAMIEALAAQP